MKTILFAPETFNLAETTRCIEIAKQCRNFARCIFSGYSLEYEELVSKEGFLFFYLTPHIETHEVKQWMRFDQGKTLHRPITTAGLHERIRQEIALIRREGICLVVIGSTISTFVSARACHIPLVYSKPFAFSLADIAQRAATAKGIVQWTYQRLLKLRYIPFGLRQIAATYGVAPYTHTLDVLEADKNLITTLPVLYDNAPLPANYYAIGPLFSQQAFPLSADIQERIHAAKAKGLPVVYFAMGSSGDSRVIRTILGYLRQCSCLVIAPLEQYLHKYEIKFLQADHIYITSWLPAKEVNKQADIAILHGGEGTLQTNALCGKPCLCIPMQQEQQYNARAYVRYGSALMLQKYRLSYRRFMVCYNRLLQDTALQQKAYDLMLEASRYNGAKRAAEYLRTML